MWIVNFSIIFGANYVQKYNFFSDCVWGCEETFGGKRKSTEQKRCADCYGWFVKAILAVGFFESNSSFLWMSQIRESKHGGLRSSSKQGWFSGSLSRSAASNQSENVKKGRGRRWHFFGC